jgi:hypothetical protein
MARTMPFDDQTYHFVVPLKEPSYPLPLGATCVDGGFKKYLFLENIYNMCSLA